MNTTLEAEIHSQNQSQSLIHDINHVNQQPQQKIMMNTAGQVPMYMSTPLPLAPHMTLQGPQQNAKNHIRC